MHDPQWLTTVRDNAGQKLAIRLRPSSAIGDAKSKYGYLLVITQQLASVKADGMPQPDYNDALFQFDSDMISQLEIDGRVVLVETHAGKRIYYAYVGDEGSAKARANQVLCAHGHSSDSSFRGGQDPNWEFYSRYLATVA